ncbi:uncharacterized protein DS421_11g340730 [Arachis hypogaea]|nr:uncharacterized protein DS421_11g340730 [Arachis hypogaea]
MSKASFATNQQKTRILSKALSFQTFKNKVAARSSRGSIYMVQADLMEKEPSGECSQATLSSPRLASRGFMATKMGVQSSPSNSIMVDPNQSPLHSQKLYPPSYHLVDQSEQN